MNRHYLEIVWYKALAELRAEAARAYLGFLWWIIEPVIYMGAFYVVFGLIFQRGGPDFVPFLLCGLLVWKWFGSTVVISSNTIVANAALMQQVYLPKYLFPAIVVVINTLKFLVVFAVLVVFLLAYGIRPTEAWLSLPLVMLTQFLLIAATAGLVSATVPFVPDFRLFLDNAIMLLFFLSGIFFDISAISGKLQSLVRLNPMAVIIENYRAVLIEGQWPDVGYMALVLAIALVGLLVARRLFARYDRIYPKVLV
jgi:lipopolysaccharide transport system permease protein